MSPSARRLLFFALLVLANGCKNSEAPTRRSGTGIGKQAPEVVGTDLEGRPLRLSDYRGKVVLVDFWRAG